MKRRRRSNPARRQQGRRNKKQGDALETHLERSCELIAARGEAQVRKRSNPLTILESLGRGQFRCVKTASEGVDFDGTLSGGRGVQFDGKTSSHDARFEFRVVSDDQLRHLAHHARLGALCFLYVRQLSTGGRVLADYLLPVDGQGHIAGTPSKRSKPPAKVALNREALAEYDAQRRESLRWEDCQGWKVRPGEDWLRAWRRLEREGKWP